MGRDRKWFLAPSSVPSPPRSSSPGGGLTQPWHTLCLYLVISLWGGAWKITLEELARMMCNALRHFNHSLLLLRSALIAPLLSAPSRLVKLCWHFTSFLVLGEEKKKPNHFQCLFFLSSPNALFFIPLLRFPFKSYFLQPPPTFFTLPSGLIQNSWAVIAHRNVKRGDPLTCSSLLAAFSPQLRRPCISQNG